jgi:hypothetical protein
MWARTMHQVLLVLLFQGAYWRTTDVQTTFLDSDGNHNLSAKRYSLYRGDSLWQFQIGLYCTLVRSPPLSLSIFWFQHRTVQRTFISISFLSLFILRWIISYYFIELICNNYASLIYLFRIVFTMFWKTQFYGIVIKFDQFCSLYLVLQNVIFHNWLLWKIWLNYLPNIIGFCLSSRAYHWFCLGCQYIQTNTSTKGIMCSNFPWWL